MSYSYGVGQTDEPFDDAGGSSTFAGGSVRVSAKRDLQRAGSRVTHGVLKCGNRRPMFLALLVDEPHEPARRRIVGSELDGFPTHRERVVVFGAQGTTCDRLQRARAPALARLRQRLPSAGPFSKRNPPPGRPRSSGAGAITLNGDLAIGVGEWAVHSGGPPRPAQRLPANQRAPEREERCL